MTGRRLGYGALAKEAARLPVPADDAIGSRIRRSFATSARASSSFVDGHDIVTGKAQYGMDTRAAGHAVRGHRAPAGVRRQGRRATMRPRRSRCPASCAWWRSRRLRRRRYFNPLGGVAVIARNTWAAMQGRKALKIDWDDGPNASYDSVAYRRELEEAARKPGQGGAQRRRLRGRGGERRTPHRGGVLPAASRPCLDGAARGERAHRAGQVRGLGLLPVTAGGARSGRQAPRHAGRGCHGARDAARRRIRPQVEARFRHRGGDAVQGDGRQAGQGGLDARRRFAPRLFPYRLRRASGSRCRCPRAAGRVAASQRRADDRVDLRGGRESGGELGAGHGRHQRALCDSQYPHRESGGDRAYAHRLVPLGLEYSACVRGAVVCRRAGRRGGARPEGLSAGADRSCRAWYRRRC